jgi:hypothetical protein
MNINSVYQFQLGFMYPVLMKILQDSSTGLNSSGFDKLDKNKGYLFISNHRDIFLDSAFLQLLLYQNNLDTSYITYGSNLVETPFFGEIGRLNKTIVVVRDGSVRERYNYSKILSEYLRYLILEKKSSVWISQRNGRTKDGNDKTQPGLLKMLNICCQSDLIQDLINLNITPLSISYQYEPCDILKVMESYVAKQKEYVKSANEDMTSILTGIKDFKGGIQYSVGTTFSDELMEISRIKGEIDKFKAIARLIDNQVYSNFKLWKTNYIAADLLKNDHKYREHYSETDKKDFEEYMSNRMKTIEGDSNVMRRMFLRIYANPVFNYQSLAPARS